MLMKALLRNWQRQTGLQLATLGVLSSAFAVITFGFLLSSNLQKVLSLWGESIQVVAYLSDSTTPDETAQLQREIEKLPQVKAVQLVDRQQASTQFKAQMASYAPGLLDGTDFENPFPASFQITLSSSANASAQALEQLAQKLRVLPHIDEVSYGQTWVQNYRSFVRVVAGAGQAIGLILVLSSLFVIANTIRAAVLSRREEIEILELVGATTSSIRMPFVFEGAVLGFFASAVAIGVNFGLYEFGVQFLGQDLNLAALQGAVHFLSLGSIALILVSGAALGATGAFLVVRDVNSGWAAAQGIES